MTSRLSLVCYAFCVVAGVTLAGCSSGGGSPALTTSPSASASVVATSSPQPPPASPTPSLSGVLAVSFSGVQAGPSLSYGAAPLQFNVTVTNRTSSAYSNITIVVSLGHCTCSKTPAEEAPQGTLEEQDTATGQWHSLFYDTEGSGMDYLNVTQLPEFTLNSGSGETFTLRLAFNPLPQRGSSYGPGQMAIDATVEALPAHKVIGNTPAASIPLNVTTS
jgi:hypothetical protein